MPNTYNANAAGSVGDSGALSITEPADGDGLAAASVNTPLSTLADNVQYLLSNAAKRGALNPNAVGIWFSLSGHILARMLKVTDLGSAGADLNYAPIDQVQDPSGNVLFESYVSAGGALVYAQNCNWNTSTTKWHLSQNGTASKVTISSNGLTVLFKAAGTAGAEWSDLIGAGGWDKSYTLDLSASFNQGDVMGSTGAGVIAMGRPREALTSGTLGAGVTGNIWAFKDASNLVHIIGKGNADFTNGSNTAIGSVPAGFAPTVITGVNWPGGYAYDGSGGQYAMPVSVDGSGNLSMINGGPGSPGLTHAGAAFSFHISYPV